MHGMYCPGLVVQWFQILGSNPDSIKTVPGHALGAVQNCLIKGGGGCKNVDHLISAGGCRG